LSDKLVYDNKTGAHIDKDGLRRYAAWAGRPEGVKEDVTRCVASVRDSGGWHSYQCERKRGFGPEGLYCRQHSNAIERAKQEEAARKAKAIADALKEEIVEKMIFGRGGYSFVFLCNDSDKALRLHDIFQHYPGCPAPMKIESVKLSNGKALVEILIPYDYMLPTNTWVLNVLANSPPLEITHTQGYPRQVADVLERFVV
jgi:hypothetical protein